MHELRTPDQKTAFLLPTELFKLLTTEPSELDISILPDTVGHDYPIKKQGTVLADGSHAWLSHSISLVNLSIELGLKAHFKILIKGALQHSPRSSSAYRFAAENGYLDAMQHLAKIAEPAYHHDMIRSINYTAYRSAAAKRHLNVMSYLEESIASYCREDMIGSSNFGVYIGAAMSSHLDVMTHVETTVTAELLQTTIASSNFGAYRIAAEHGHLNVMQHLEKIVEQDQLQTMIESYDFGAYRFASTNNHLDVKQYLLNNEKTFAHVEHHHAEQHGQYGSDVQIFIAKKLTRACLQFTWAAT